MGLIVPRRLKRTVSVGPIVPCQHLTELISTVN